MRQFCGVTLALLLTAVSSTPQQRAGGGSVTGTIFCEDTKEPARRADVFLLEPVDPSLRFFPPGGGFGAKTALDGSFTISNVTPGEYYVIALYPGYISARWYIFPEAMAPEATGLRDPLPSFVQRISVEPGGAEHVEIQLKRGGSISGVATYSDGTPVPYMALNPKIKMPDGTFEDGSSGAFQADDAGNYRVDGLPDGSYSLLGALSDGPPVAVLGGAQAGGGGWIMFAGGGMRPSSACIITVAAPKEYTGVNIVIPLTGVYNIGGNVVAKDGHRLNHGMVRLYPTGEPRFPLAARLAADGTFQFRRTPPDTYTVRVEDASDWKMIKEQATFVQSFSTASVNVTVTDADLANVSVVVSTDQ
jgi:hypothetical protein